MANEECPHCKFIEETFCGDHPIDSNRNYWHMTEVFVYLHDGKSYCTFKKKPEVIKKGV